ncbi:hypothetical protein P154DRAFT_526679 [Amniculicola lignicola CBS 123094]|uniref:Uncharacterized protein n=1 Tax=Amniculicola lignicola CBS 123094 TaxID=1392246 RepID=A0A6A5VZ43_9PLEO|nr:hypothetical protein P154DRAFT_526679 [Amniculicola lignicola CBS 123094]
MASYFDLPQRPNATGAADGPGNGALGNRSMLTPQLTSILDELGNEHSSSDDELDSDSGHEEEREIRADKPKGQSPLRKASTSPLPQGEKEKLAPPRPGPRHPHLARFHSLRSMLFSTRIEESIAQIQEREAQERAEAKWKEEHKNRLSMTRPKTPPSPKSPKGSPTKEGFAHRAVNRLKRIGSREVYEMPTMNENEVFESSEGSEVEKSKESPGLKNITEDPPSDTESLGQDHVDELVRWVSRRDTPNSDEAPRGREKTRPFERPDENRSLVNSDVEELVRHVSRRSEPTEEVEHRSLSDASTASDSDGAGRRDSFGNEDVEDLMRWISRKEGANAGPVRENEPKAKRKVERQPVAISPGSDADDSDSGEEPTQWVSLKEASKTAFKAAPVPGLNEDTMSGTDIGSHYDTDHPPDLKRWITRADSTSGESQTGDGLTTTDMDAEDRRTEEKKEVDELVRLVTHRDAAPAETSETTSTQEKEEITNDDVDDLVRWISRKDDKEPEADPGSMKKLVDGKRLDVDTERGSLRGDDVDELVRWVTRKEDDKQEPNTQEEQRDAIGSDESKSIQISQDEQARTLGRTEDHGSLAPEDLDEIVKWVSKRESDAQEGAKAEEQRDEGILNWGEEEKNVQKEQREKQSLLRVSNDNGSLANEDVDELVRWVSRREGDAEDGVKEEERRDDNILKWVEEEKKIQGEQTVAEKTADVTERRKGSLGEEDVNELLKWVSRK